MLDVKVKHAVRSAVSAQREPEIAEVGIATEVDHLRKQWEQDFLTAMRPVPEPFRVQLLWLCDWRARVDVVRATLGSPEFLDDMLIDPKTDEATRIAWAAKSYFARNSAEQERHNFSEADLRTMQNPRVFLGGTLSS
jgi:hypothetical protein